MAIMINCAVDWTYDKYLEDVNFFDIDNSMEDEYYPAYFVSCMKKAVEKFRSEWVEKHTYLYASGYGYVGDAFAETLQDGWFSDFYKDAYGQRPHLPIWFYVHPLGLPMQEDTARMFCADPIKEARNESLERRAYMRRAF